MARPDKVAVVDRVAEQLTEAEATLLTDYRGLSVTELAELRAELRKVEATYEVVKNTLTRLAATQAGMDGLDDMLVGPTAIVFCGEDPVGPAKALKEFAKDHEQLVVKGGYLDGEVLDAEAAAKLADLASREELLATLAGMMNNALAGFARLLQAPIAQMARLAAALEADGGVEAKGFSPTAPAATTGAEDPADVDTTSSDSSDSDSSDSDDSPDEAAAVAEDDDSPDEPAAVAASDDSPDEPAAVAEDDDSPDEPAAVVDTVDEVADATEQVAADVETAAEEVGADVAATADAAAADVGDTSTEAADAVAGAAADAADAAEDVTDDAASTAEDVAERVADVAESAADAVADLADSAAATIADVAESVADTAESAAAAVADAASTVAEAVTDGDDDDSAETT